MRGRDVLWQPGMDHAGIATQMVVERQMMERQEPGRREIGREKFLEKVWAWKAESGGLIINQLKRLGCSCDWSRERFTMDEGLSKAVTKVFVDLYREKLIYRDKRLVNWDPTLQTAISDLEVENIEMQGHLWHFRYPIEDREGRFIVVATTRPETMLGDTGIAVHPGRRALQGPDRQECRSCRWSAGKLRIVADEHADPETGSGAVKITPAHDFNDFEVGKRQNLPMVNIFDTEANVVLEGNAEFLDGVPESDELKATIAAINGLDRFTARKRIVEMMEEKGLLEKVEDKPVMVPHDEKSKTTIIEPYLTDQWYADAEDARPAGDRVGARRAHGLRPARTGKRPTSNGWRTSVHGAFPASSGGATRSRPGTGRMERSSSRTARTKPGRRRRPLPGADGPDPRRGRPRHLVLLGAVAVLDARLAGPDAGAGALLSHVTALVTGFDIIFFWVARMMMSGLHFMGKEPFRDVYIHALVRDEKGAKMSKTKGNVIDPIVLIDEFGADALRFTLAAMAAQGRDIKLADGRVEGYRNFATKLWNAARFAEHYECRRVADFDPANATETLNRWIATETTRAAPAVTTAIEAYRFNDAAAALYRFTWNLFCDWYVELIQAGAERRGRPGKGGDAGDRRLGARPDRRVAPSRSCRSSPRSSGRGRETAVSTRRPGAQRVARTGVRGRRTRPRRSTG